MLVRCHWRVELPFIDRVVLELYTHLFVLKRPLPVIGEDQVTSMGNSPISKRRIVFHSFDKRVLDVLIHPHRLSPCECCQWLVLDVENIPWFVWLFGCGHTNCLLTLLYYELYNIHKSSGMKIYIQALSFIQLVYKCRFVNCSRHKRFEWHVVKSLMYTYLW